MPMVMKICGSREATALLCLWALVVQLCALLFAAMTIRELEHSRDATTD